MPKIFYTEDEYESLKYENQQLTTKLAALEELRPQWAQGFSSDSQAAQTTSAALYALWAKLRVSEQTSAMRVLNILIEEVARSRSLTA
jgi:hypothetical protein